MVAVTAATGKKPPMTRPVPLTAAERAALPATLPLWQLTDNRDAILRRFTFADFSAAWGFMARVALLAERHDHHPEWSNTYNRVEIVLTTHDCNGLSASDVALARAVDALA